MTQIADPADRLTGEFVDALRARYGRHENSWPIVVPDDEYALIYGRVCDVACQVVWPEQYGVTPDDEMMNTSKPARAFALIVMAAVGIRNETDLAFEAAAEPEP